jgi:hypothetical protein
MYKGCTRVVQGIYKGCTREQHPRNTGAIPEQYRSNTGAIPEQYRSNTGAIPEQYRSITLVSGVAQGIPAGLARVQYCKPYFSGSFTVKVLPTLTSLATSMLPPWASTMALQIARPSPLRPSARDRDLSAR